MDSNQQADIDRPETLQRQGIAAQKATSASHRTGKRSVAKVMEFQIVGGGIRNFCVGIQTPLQVIPPPEDDFKTEMTSKLLDLIPNTSGTHTHQPYSVYLGVKMAESPIKLQDFAKWGEHGVTDATREIARPMEEC